MQVTPFGINYSTRKLILDPIQDTDLGQAILEALQKTEGNRTAAARLLGVTFRSLRYRLERLGID